MDRNATHAQTESHNKPNQVLQYKFFFLYALKPTLIKHLETLVCVKQATQSHRLILVIQSFVASRFPLIATTAKKKQLLS